MNASHKWAESTLEIKDTLQNIDNKADLQKFLGEKHDNAVDQLQKIKKEIKEIDSH